MSDTLKWEVLKEPEKHLITYGNIQERMIIGSFSLYLDYTDPDSLICIIIKDAEGYLVHYEVLHDPGGIENAAKHALKQFRKWLYNEKNKIETASELIGEEYE